MDKTGDVGNKNLRPYKANDYEKHGLSINGVHSYGSPAYRMRSSSNPYNHQDTWMLRNRMGNNLIGAHGNDRLKMDGALAARLEAMPEVKRAYVLLADERAYVGIKENRSAAAPMRAVDVQPELRRRIAERIGSVFPAVRQVYVTSNPEYLDRMKVYSDEEKAGRPVLEFLAEFNALAARIFPAVTYSGEPGVHPAPTHP